MKSSLECDIYTVQLSSRRNPQKAVTIATTVCGLLLLFLLLATLVLVHYLCPSDYHHTDHSHHQHQGNDETSQSGLHYLDKDLLVLTSFSKRCLLVHNEYRAKHGVPSLCLSLTLSKSAKEVAERNLKKGRLLRSNGPNGENLFSRRSVVNTGATTKLWNSSRSVDCRLAVEAWYEGIKEYNFSRPGPKFGTKDFAQLVWKSTKEVGCGYASNLTVVYIACHYSPKGNVPDEYEFNVLDINNNSRGL